MLTSDHHRKDWPKVPSIASLQTLGFVFHEAPDHHCATFLQRDGVELTLHTVRHPTTNNTCWTSVAPDGYLDSPAIIRMADITNLIAERAYRTGLAKGQSIAIAATAMPASACPMIDYVQRVGAPIDPYCRASTAAAAAAACRAQQAQQFARNAEAQWVDVLELLARRACGVATQADKARFNAVAQKCDDVPYHHAFYSAEAARQFGTIEYMHVDGYPVNVTCVSNDPGSFYGWADKIYVGRVRRGTCKRRDMAYD